MVSFEFLTEFFRVQSSTRWGGGANFQCNSPLSTHHKITNFRDSPDTVTYQSLHSVCTSSANYSYCETMPRDGKKRETIPGDSKLNIKLTYQYQRKLSTQTVQAMNILDSKSTYITSPGNSFGVQVIFPSRQTKFLWCWMTGHLTRQRPREWCTQTSPKNAVHRGLAFKTSTEISKLFIFKFCNTLFKLLTHNHCFLRRKKAYLAATRYKSKMAD